MTEHIKMPAITPLVRYASNGTQTVFEYPFPIFASEDVHVYFDSARQYSGFDVQDAGMTSGGTITFDQAPAAGIVLTLARRLPLERMSDFIEGGEFSAAAINTELDYIVAGSQQIARDQSVFLRYADHELPAQTILPERALRAGKALGFDGDGNPIPVSLEGSMALPDVVMAGSGAVIRTTQDKMRDCVSIKDFGAIGDGLQDDTLAIQKALSAHDHVYVPPGSYLVTGVITLSGRQSLAGAGQASVIVGGDEDVNIIEITGPYNQLSDLRLEGGNIAVRLYGRDGVCVQNAVTDVAIFGASIGVQLDGYIDPNYPCYWNNFDRVLVAQMTMHGFHLMRSGSGDTANANKFHACRAYSLGADTAGIGFYVEEGSFNNAFIDCEANVKGTAQGCFTLGAGSYKTLLINPYAESNNGVPNIKLEAGSRETSIINLLSMSDGAAIWDLSGSDYTAYNAGYPYKNTLQKTRVSDIQATMQRYDTEYVEASGTVTLDTSHSVHLVSSYGGALIVKLPKASEAEACMMVIKKVDISANVITVTEDAGAGPDGKNYYLGADGDYVQVVSNGAEWHVISSNRAPGNTRFYEGSGTYDIDMAVDTYLLSSWGGALTARLPPADAPEAVGKSVTIKKTDPSSNIITITELGGVGPDNYAQTLTAQYRAMTVVSNGGQWFVISKY